MLFHRAVLLLGLVAPYLSSAQGTAESFDEELVLRPLPDGKLSLLFEYKLQVAARRRHGSGIGESETFHVSSQLVEPILIILARHRLAYPFTTSSSPTSHPERCFRASSINGSREMGSE